MCTDLPRPIACSTNLASVNSCGNIVSEISLVPRLPQGLCHILYNIVGKSLRTTLSFSHPDERTVTTVAEHLEKALALNF